MLINVAVQKLPTEHPAKMSPEIVKAIAEILPTGASLRLLDPMAGIGSVHGIRDYRPMVETVGVELEPEWAEQHPCNQVGNVLALDFADATFDVVATSPPYANRMADHHDARDDSRRITYKHSLGRDLSPDNAGGLQWGDGYCAFFEQAWRECRRVLKPGGYLVLNHKDHYRDGVLQPVTDWHVEHLIQIGFTVEQRKRVRVRSMGFGANGGARTGYEDVILFRYEGDVMKNQKPYTEAMAVANELVDWLRPACNRIVVAGSLRRQCAEIGDIELVALPTPLLNLFGEPTGETLLDLHLRDTTLSKNGDRQKQFTYQGYQVDLFLARPDTLGYILLLRTGSAAFSHSMVTPKSMGGLRPPHITLNDGQVFKHGAPVAVPDEATLFALWEMTPVTPEQRNFV